MPQFKIDSIEDRYPFGDLTLTLKANSSLDDIKKMIKDHGLNVSNDNIQLIYDALQKNFKINEIIKVIDKRGQELLKSKVDIETKNRNSQKEQERQEFLIKRTQEIYPVLETVVKYFNDNNRQSTLQSLLSIQMEPLVQQFIQRELNKTDVQPLNIENFNITQLQALQRYIGQRDHKKELNDDALLIINKMSHPDALNFDVNIKTYLENANLIIANPKKLIDKLEPFLKNKEIANIIINEANEINAAKAINKAQNANEEKEILDASSELSVAKAALTTCIENQSRGNVQKLITKLEEYCKTSNIQPISLPIQSITTSLERLSVNGQKTYNEEKSAVLANIDDIPATMVLAKEFLNKYYNFIQEDQGNKQHTIENHLLQLENQLILQNISNHIENLTALNTDPNFDFTKQVDEILAEIQKQHADRKCSFEMPGPKVMAKIIAIEAAGLAATVIVTGLLAPVPPMAIVAGVAAGMATKIAVASALDVLLDSHTDIRKVVGEQLMDESLNTANDALIHISNVPIAKGIVVGVNLAVNSKEEDLDLISKQVVTEAAAEVVVGSIIEGVADKALDGIPIASAVSKIVAQSIVKRDLNVETIKNNPSVVKVISPLYEKPPTILNKKTVEEIDSNVDKRLWLSLLALKNSST